MKSTSLSRVVHYLFVFVFGTVCGFNLDVKSPVIYKGPYQSELFGYSVAAHSYNGKQWLLVGAPLSNITSSFPSETTLVKYGNVFKCHYKPGSNDCTAVVVDDEPIRKEPLSFPNGTTLMVETEKKTDQWFGATLRSTGKDGNVVACAPRYIYAQPTSEDKNIINHQYHSLIGRCFQISRDLQRSQGRPISPCEGQSGRKRGFCITGMDAEFTADGHALLMGAPGINLMRGGVVVHLIDESTTYQSPIVPQTDSYMGYAVTSGHFLSLQTTEIVGGAPRNDDLYGSVLLYSIENDIINVRSKISRPQGINVGSYFGSALCAVDLTSDLYSDLLVGAPRAHYSDQGRVFVYVNNGKGALNLQDSLSLKGDNMPYAQFGQAIARVGDLNKDGFQDVAIGAPFEAGGSGSVYIYHGSLSGINPIYKQKIQGSSVDAGLRTFGSAISGTVDMDDNGYPDVAVGAYGSNKAVLLRTRSIVNVEGRISLSRYQISVESNDSLCRLDDDKDHKCLNLSVCFENKGKTLQSYEGLRISFTVELDRIKTDRESDHFRRMFFVDEKLKSTVFTISGVHNVSKEGDLSCSFPRTVYFKEKDKLADVASSLSFDLSFGLVKSCGRDLCPVLNSSVQTMHSEKAFFMKRCQNQQVCIPDLAVDGNVSFVGYDGSKKYSSFLRIGVVKELILQLNISNKANDYAYYSKFVVKYPKSLSYQRTVEDCTELNAENGTQSQITLSCDVGRRIAFPGLSHEIFNLKFSAVSVEEDFTFAVTTESQDTDSNQEDNSKEFSVAVKYEADLVVNGYSKPDQVIYSGAVKQKDELKEMTEEEIGPEIIQTIKVSNQGPSVVDGSQVTITVPKLLKKNDEESYLMYLLQVEVIGPGSCNVLVNTLNIKSAKRNNSVNTQNAKRGRRGVISLDCSQAVCQTFECSLGRLWRGERVEIKLTSRLWQNTLLKLDKPLVVELETVAKVRPPSKVLQPDTENDVTTITLTAKPTSRSDRSKVIPWWVYLVSALAGILLLALAVLVLYKLGFFKRKKKSSDVSAEELAPMKKD